MPRIQPMNAENAKGEVRELYQSLEKKLGRVPNIFLNMGNSPLMLKGFLALNAAANHTNLLPKTREQIALLVSQINHCQYCLSAHTMMAEKIGMSEQEILKARQAESQDTKDQAILKFTKQVIEQRGNVSNQDVASIKAAGIDDSEFVEIILVIMENIFTNYFNLITDPKIDFPLASEMDSTNLSKYGSST